MSAGWCCNVVEVAELTTISLLGDCADPMCVALEQKMLGTLDMPKYRDGAAIMRVPESLDEWRAEHRTARKRSDRCERLGYYFSEIDRSNYSDDIFEINVSLPQRQGRMMSAGYLEHHQQGKLPDYPCERHAIRTYGVTDPYGKLVSYMTLYRVNELALVSMILGHGDHLANDVMYLLFGGMIAEQTHLGGVLYYNRWDSGQDGLRYYKSKIGFSEGGVRWEP